MERYISLIVITLPFYRFFQHALSNKVTGSGPAQCSHWLDNATDEYEVYRLSV